MQTIYGLGVTDYEARKSWCGCSAQSPVVYRMLRFPCGSWSEACGAWGSREVLQGAGDARLCGLVCCCRWFVVHASYGTLVLSCNWEGMRAEML